MRELMILPSELLWA